MRISYPSAAWVRATYSSLRTPTLHANRHVRQPDWSTQSLGMNTASPHISDYSCLLKTAAHIPHPHRNDIRHVLRAGGDHGRVACS